MKIAAFLNGTKRDQALAASLIDGFKRHGEQVTVYDTAETTGPEEGDLVLFVGVRLTSHRIYKTAVDNGQKVMLLDKGYFRRGAYHRFAVGGFQPYYLGQGNKDPRRFNGLFQAHEGALFVRPDGYRAHKVVYVEQTKKYYDFQRLGFIGDYCERICARVSELIATRPDLGLQLVYRPKACARKGSDYHGMPIQPPNTLYSDPEVESYRGMFPDIHCVLIDGSNAGVEAAMAGVPVIAINGKACPLSDLVNTRLEDVLAPKVPPIEQLGDRLAELAWCQYTNEEIASGYAWDNLKGWVERLGSPQAGVQS